MRKLLFLGMIIATLAIAFLVASLWSSQYTKNESLKLNRQKAIADCIEKQVGKLTGTGFYVSQIHAQAKARCEGYFSN